jgi:hypothetical protein
MITSTIVSAAKHDGKLHVLVEVKYAESFRQFLVEKGIKCGFLSEAVFQGAKIHRDNNGQWHHEQECTVKTFEADCPNEVFRKLTDDWCLVALYRKPNSN